MRIGGFWGLPAPMFVLAFEERESALPYFQMLRATVSSDVLYGLQQELTVLHSIKDIAKYTTKMQVIAEINNLHFANGELLNSDLSPLFEKEFVERAAMRILDLAYQGKYYDVTDLAQKVNTWLKTQSFPVTQVNRKIKEFVQTLGSTSLNPCESILQTYDFDLILPEFIVVNGVRRTLSKDEKNVLQYFIKRADDIAWWIEHLHINEAKDNVVFGVPFFQLIRRKPESIRYAVLNMFSYVKQGTNTKVLENLLNSVRNDVKKFEEMYSKYVNVQTFSENTIMSGHKLAEICQTEETTQFFLQLEQKGVIRFDDYTVDDFKLLVELYAKISKLYPTYVCDTLHVSPCNLDTFGRSMSEFGVCGLNGHSVELFGKAFGEITLSANKIFRTQEVVEKVDAILHNDVMALLDTMLPVGGVISG